MECDHFTHVCCKFLELLFMCLSLLICISIILLINYFIVITVELVSGCARRVSGKRCRIGQTKLN